MAWTSLDELLEMMGHVAYDVLINKKEEQLMATWLLVNPDNKRSLVGTPWKDNFDKQVMVARVKRQMIDEGTLAYGFMTEAWMADVPKGEDIRKYSPVSEQPNKKEMVIALAADKHECRYRQWEIVRDKNGKVTNLPLRELKDFEGFSSWLADLLKEDL